MSCGPINQLQARHCGCHYCESGDNGQPSQPMTFNLTSSCVASGLGDECAERLNDEQFETLKADNCGILDPVEMIDESLSCGPFWFTYSYSCSEGSVPSPYTGTIGALLYWDGAGKWKTDWYCRYDGNTPGIDTAEFPCTGFGWDYFATETLGHTFTSCGITFTGNVPEMPCCCETGVETICCGEVLVPTTLTLEITCPVSCSYAGTYTITYGTYLGVEGWYSPGFTSSGNRIGIRCDEIIGWFLYSPDTGIAGANADSVTCDPFELTWSTLEFTACPDTAANNCTASVTA